jgi:hypothetical protein
MKKTIRLTEDDLINIVKRVLNEQFNGEIQEPESKSTEQDLDREYNKSGDDELNSRMESYKNKMDNFLDKLKSSGDKIDGTRFLKQVRNQTDQIYWELDEKSEKPLTSFAQLQLDLLRHFRHKLNEQ